jgi:hypothetical protein
VEDTRFLRSRYLFTLLSLLFQRSEHDTASQMHRKRMTIGMANNAAIVFDEAVDASTTGIICTVVVYGVLNVWEVCCSTVKSWRRGVKEVVRPRECLPCTGPSSGPVSVPVFWTRLCTCLLDPSLHPSFGPVPAPVLWTHLWTRL